MHRAKSPARPQTRTPTRASSNLGSTRQTTTTTTTTRATTSRINTGGRTSPQSNAPTRQARAPSPTKSKQQSPPPSPRHTQIHGVGPTSALVAQSRATRLEAQQSADRAQSPARTLRSASTNAASAILEKMRLLEATESKERLLTQVAEGLGYNQIYSTRPHLRPEIALLNRQEHWNNSNNMSPSPAGRHPVSPSLGSPSMSGVKPGAGSPLSPLRRGDTSFDTSTSPYRTVQTTTYAERLRNHRIQQQGIQRHNSGAPDPAPPVTPSNQHQSTTSNSVNLGTAKRTTTVGANANPILKVPSSVFTELNAQLLLSQYMFYKVELEKGHQQLLLNTSHTMHRALMDEYTVMAAKVRRIERHEGEVERLQMEHSESTQRVKDHYSNSNRPVGGDHVSQTTTTTTVETTKQVAFHGDNDHLEASQRRKEHLAAAKALLSSNSTK